MVNSIEHIRLYSGCLLYTSQKGNKMDITNAEFVISNTDVRKCTGGAFPHVCVTDDEFSVCNIHFIAFLGFYVWQR